MSRPIIEVRGLSKRYRLGAIGATSLREEFHRYVDRLRGVPHPDAQEFWALRDVSFDVQPGEVVGVIGRNGAGKSTLLKILSRITEPTSGTARLRGRVASLLEVGTGFHPELTGRENIFLNGAILGMSRAEVRLKLDEIVAFAEIEKFIDTPVKRYSSGMYVRLAFAVAAHLEPEILIVDEVLAVGDAQFQKKCLGKMQDVAGKEGRTVLFVSHNMATVQSLCERTLWLDRGRLVHAGSTTETMQLYLQSVVPSEQTPLNERTDRTGDGTVRVTDLRIQNCEAGEAIHVGSRVRVTLHYHSAAPLMRPRFLVGAYDLNNTGLVLLDSEAAGGLPDTMPSSGAITCTTAPLNFTPGQCYLNVGLMIAGAMADYVQYAAHFDIEPADFYGTGRLPTREWVLCVTQQSWSYEQVNR